MGTRQPAASSASPASFYWYDLETSGTHPASDRILQFAGLRTDAALNPVEEPFCTFVRLSPDVLPSPEACLVTGITPQRADAEGIDEWEALREIDRRMRQPGTCVAGYNNLRFDDDFLRTALYRNLMDPYAREWQNGNSRWDLIDLARAAYALRPDGITWPREAGVVTFRLERLCAANGIRQDVPHDAQWDVEATVGFARLLKEAQPKLWDYALEQRFRGNVAGLLLPLGERLCVHVSQRFSNERYCAAPVVSVGFHPEIRNRVVVVDLSRDIDMLIDCDAEQLKRRIFATDLADDEARAPVKEVVMNRCPFVAPINVVRKDDVRRLGFDLDEVERRRRALAKVPDLATKIGQAYRRDAPSSAVDDAEFALYDGFIEDVDKAAMGKLQQALASGKPWPDFRPRDPRLEVLASRLKARLRPGELDVHEAATWHDHIRRCLEDGFGRRPSLAGYRAQVAELAKATADPARQSVLQDLASYEC